MKSCLTQIAPDSASPQGTRRDFSSFGSEQRMVRVKNAGAREQTVRLPEYLEDIINSKTGMMI